MTATNHALTGAIIGFSVSQPWLAIPLAFGSHFVLDSLPHFGFSKLNDRGRRFTTLLLTDTTLCISLVVLLLLSGSNMWIMASLTAFVATSPDFMWAPDYFRQKFLRTPENHQSNILKQFHSKIQWYQKPPGAFIEVIYFGASASYLVNLV